MRILKILFFEYVFSIFIYKLTSSNILYVPCRIQCFCRCLDTFQCRNKGSLIETLISLSLALLRQTELAFYCFHLYNLVLHVLEPEFFQLIQFFEIQVSLCFRLHFYVNISVLFLACVTISALDFVDCFIIVILYFSFCFELVDHNSVNFFCCSLRFRDKPRKQRW